METPFSKMFRSKKRNKALYIRRACQISMSYPIKLGENPVEKEELRKTYVLEMCEEVENIKKISGYLYKWEICTHCSWS